MGDKEKLSRRDFLKAVAAGGGSLVLGGLLSACERAGIIPTTNIPTNIPASPEKTLKPADTDTPVPTEPQPTPTPSGPETTPNVPQAYPTSLTVEMAERGIGAVKDAPPSITGLADVQYIVTKHTQLARETELSFDHMAVKYVPADQRWFLVPVKSDGTTVAGWLEIEDPSSQSGWRYGEQPTWDSRYSPSRDKYKYGLPVFHDPANQYKVGFENGFPILIEETADGAPQYWNNIVQKSMMPIEGAVNSTEIPTPEQITLSRDPDNPTQMTLAEFSSAKFKSYEFGPEAKLIPGTYFLVNQKPEWSTFIFYRDKYPDPKTRPLALNGFMDVTMPDGTVILAVQESVMNSDRIVAEWNFGFSQEDFNKYDEFIKEISSGAAYLVPQGKKGDPKACREWNSPYVCEHAIPGVAEMVEDFVKTGISDPRLSQGFLIFNSDYWRSDMK